MVWWFNIYIQSNLSFSPLAIWIYIYIFALRLIWILFCFSFRFYSAFIKYFFRKLGDCWCVFVDDEGGVADMSSTFQSASTHCCVCPPPPTSFDIAEERVAHLHRNKSNESWFNTYFSIYSQVEAYKHIVRTNEHTQKEKCYDDITHPNLMCNSISLNLSSVSHQHQICCYFSYMRASFFHSTLPSIPFFSAHTHTHSALIFIIIICCCCCFQRCVFILFYFLGYTFYSYNFALPSYFNLSPYLLLGCVHLLHIYECVGVRVYARYANIYIRPWDWDYFRRLARTIPLFFHLYSYHENL